MASPENPTNDIPLNQTGRIVNATDEWRYLRVERPGPKNSGYLLILGPTEDLNTGFVADEWYATLSDIGASFTDPDRQWVVEWLPTR